VLGLAAGEPPYRLLIVDDHASSRLLLRAILEPLGFALGEAANGAEAVAMVGSFNPHGVLMDLQMPIMDGYEATRRIRALPAGEGCRIVAMSASLFADGEGEIKAAGCDVYLRKPFHAEELLELLRRQLGLRYRYQDEPPSGLQPPAAASAEAPHLERLPSEWRNRFRQATREGRFQQLQALVDEVRPAYAAEAEQVEQLLQRYQLDRLLELVQP
jgi:CheY-like chemotaxis protein